MFKLMLRRRAVAMAVVAVLGIAGGLMTWASTFTTNLVHDQLVAQKIEFPPAGSPALDPKQFPGLQRYAGQAVDDGPSAKAFANQYIAAHLEKVAGGKTYSEVSSAARADPSDRALAGQRQALFEGETLRGLLLSAWGWSVVGSIAGLSAYAVLAAAALVAALTLAASLAARPARSERTALVRLAPTSA